MDSKGGIKEALLSRGRGGAKDETVNELKSDLAQMKRDMSFLKVCQIPCIQYPMHL